MDTPRWYKFSLYVQIRYVYISRFYIFLNTFSTKSISLLLQSLYRSSFSAFAHLREAPLLVARAPLEQRRPPGLRCPRPHSRPAARPRPTLSSLDSVSDSVFPRGLLSALPFRFPLRPAIFIGVSRAFLPSFSTHTALQW